MEARVDEIIARYEELSRLLADPATIADQQAFVKLSIEQGELSDSYAVAKKLRSRLNDKKEAEDLLEEGNDPDLAELYQETLASADEEIEALEAQFAELTRETDPNDKRSVIIEIRAGTGGDEAALFAADLYRMYTRYAEQKGFTVEQMSSNYAGTGGFKEVIFSIGGKAFGELKFENGVHRVQRVPATEAAGRIHTSAASVVVLPEADDVEIEIRDEDLRIDVYRSSGPGGQSVNTTDSAVRMTHIPTGIVVTCQDEKSQLKNKKKALSVLKSRLYDLELQKQQQQERDSRQSAIAGGDRSAKIRTYNFPQSRVTDHRIKQSWYNLHEILDGALQEVLDALKQAEYEHQTGD
ncbi:MAG: Peptide chain release factor 1 [candidate division WS6 bacterium OLB20]|uniref:Peptide chain release factor 1 n=1 Tax=candidate division WS6 bacterium OLB20 TaxID=1617426 RepID=A0A136LY86_9BACT|nr:MAG: Peptide chain release factor 1 [candidate division WS6 bacterium OLB20]